MAISRANKEFNFVKFCEVNDYKFKLNKDDFVRDVDNLPIGITVEINTGAVISFMPAQGHYEELPMHHNKSTACDLFCGESFKAIDNDWYSSKTYTVTHFIQLAYEVSYEEAKRYADNLIRSDYERYDNSEGCEVNFIHYNEKGKPLKTIENVSAILDFDNTHLKYNSFTHQIEVYVNGERCYYSAEETFEDFTIMLKSKCLVFGINLSFDESYKYGLIIAKKDIYNPVQDFLNECDELGLHGEDNINDFINNYIVFQDDVTQERAEFLRDMFKRFLCLTSVIPFNDESLPRPYTQEFIPVFQGEQGVMKTTFAKHLAVNKFYKDGVNIDPRDKDTLAKAFIGTWLTELGELGSTTKRSVNGLKAIINSNNVEFRSPYDRQAKKYMRTSVLFGTVNETEYLRDVTGNRRFVSMPVKELKMPSEELMRKVYCECRNLVREDKIKMYMTKEEIISNDIYNGDFVVKADEYDVVARYMPCVEKAEEQGWGYINASEACRYILQQSEYIYNVKPNRVTNALRQLYGEPVRKRLGKNKNAIKYYKAPYLKGYSEEIED